MISKLILIFKKIFFPIFKKKKVEQLSLKKILFIIDEVILLKDSTENYLLKSAELTFHLENSKYREDIEKYLQEHGTFFEYRIEEDKKCMTLFLIKKE